MHALRAVFSFPLSLFLSITLAPSNPLEIIKIIKIILLRRKWATVSIPRDSSRKGKKKEGMVIGHWPPSQIPAIRFREHILTLDSPFLHQYLIVANKMAVVCTPPRWAIKARGGPVIVNLRSRYISVLCTLVRATTTRLHVYRKER